MSTARSPRPNLDWYRKAAKKKLAELRARRPAAQLAAAQLLIAREHGFSSWRTLKQFVDAAQAEDFFEAIRRGDASGAKRMLTERPELTSARTPNGETALHIAAERNQPQIVALLVSAGADPRKTYGSSAHTPLSWALTTGSFAAAEQLVRSGVTPDLFCAAGLGALDAVKTFFDANGRLRPRASQSGSSRFAADGQRLASPPSDPRDVVSDALYIASRNGRASVVRFLLTRNPDVNFRAFLGGTPLHWAYYASSRPVVAMLSRAGADPALRDAEFNCTPRAFGISVVANWGIVPLVKRALQSDPSLANVHDGRGTPLHEAARSGALEVVRILLKAGAVPTVRDSNGQTPLDLALAHEHDELAQALRAFAKE
jgi:ankyrin repeat protein